MNKQAMENKGTVLVTGGTGMVGAQCILQLLKKGYSVKTTLRSTGKKDEVTGMLQNGGITSFEGLSFVEADLTKDAHWAEAMQGCRYVLHVASPTHLYTAGHEDEMIKPAVEGTLRVLKAAKNSGVQRVVMTSSFGALGFSNKDRNTVTTEDHWTDPNEKGLSAYEKSKVLAERAAWDFIKNEGGALELAVINPVAIFGPALGPSKSPSLGLLKMLLDGAKAIPDIPLNVVDIRDVADLHVRAMETPEAQGQRFIASADGRISLPEIAALLKKKMPEVSGKVSTKTIPDWVIRIAALFNAQARQAAGFLPINRNISNEKAKKVLGWKPLSNNEQAVLAAVASMKKFGMIK